jgi:hypothetical protein
MYLYGVYNTDYYKTHEFTDSWGHMTAMPHDMTSLAPHINTEFLIFTDGLDISTYVVLAKRNHALGTISLWRKVLGFKIRWTIKEVCSIDRSTVILLTLYNPLNSAKNCS